jgi:DHA2 family multidrug resistance protein
MAVKNYHGSLFFISIAVCLGTFIQVLDTSIANVSIPYIAGDLGTSANEGTWVITSFSVSNAVVLPMTGWLATRFGEARVFIWSTSLFSIISWLCGFAENLPMLIFFRVLQGAAGGALIPLSQSILLQIYPEDKKGLALSFWSMIVVVAPIAGPILGGYLTDNYSWRWIFYINVPIGLLAAFLTWYILGPEKEDELTERKPLDISAFILLTLGVSCFQIMLDKGEQLDWFNNPIIISLAVISAIGFVLFTVWNYLSLYPFVDFSFFRYKNYLVGTLISALAYMIFFGGVVLLPLWLQTQQNYTSLWAGYAVAPIGFMPLLLSTILGRYMNSLDLRIILSIGFAIFSYTFFWYSTFTTEVSFVQIIYPRIVQGIGLSCYFVPAVTLALAPIPNRDLSSASGVFHFIRIFAGGGIGTSVFVTLWDRREVFHHERLAEAINPYNPNTLWVYDILADNGIEGSQANVYVDSLVQNQAYMLSTNDVFWLSGWIFVIMIPFVWLCTSHRKFFKPGQQHVAVGGE